MKNNFTNNINNQVFEIYSLLIHTAEQINDEDFKLKVLRLLLTEKDLCLQLIFSFASLNGLFYQTPNPTKQDLKDIRFTIKKAVIKDKDFKEFFAVLFQVTNYLEIYKNKYSREEIFFIQENIKKVLFHFN